MVGSYGGAIFVTGHPWMKHIIFQKCKFLGNTARNSGGAILTATIGESAKNVIALCLFINNSASKGAAVFSDIDTIAINGSNYTANIAEIGVLHCVQSIIHIQDNVFYSFNRGSIFLFGSSLRLIKGSHFWGENNSSPTQTKSVISFLEGGVITTFQSNVVLDKKSNCTLLYNKAVSGGALHAMESKIFVHGHLHAMNNSATNSGGCIYLYQSQLTCEHQSFLTLLFNTASKTGGGIHASNSVIKMHFTEYEKSPLGPGYKYGTYDGSYAAFVGNSAIYGGGVYLEVNSKFNVPTYNLLETK